MPVNVKVGLKFVTVVFVTLSLMFVTGCSKTPVKTSGRKWADALREPDVNRRKKAAFTLGNIGPTDPAVLPSLIAALKDDPDAEVRCEAILSLLKLGPEAKKAIPELTEAQQNDKDETVRSHAEKALTKLKGS